MYQERTFSDLMPPSRIERVIWAPTGNIFPICRTSVVLERVSWADVDLMIKVWE